MVNDLSGLIDALPGLAWTARLDGTVDFLNRRWFEYTGTSNEAAMGHGWASAIHPDDQAGLIECWRSILESGMPHEMNARLRRFDGEYRWFLFRTAPITDVAGQTVKWCGFNTDVEDRIRSGQVMRGRDVDERRQSEDLLAGEKLLLEMVARGSDLPLVLDALCKLGEKTANGSHCGILFFAPGGATWQHGAGPTLPPGYNKTMHGRPAHRAGGPCGLAASLKTQVIVPDVHADLRWDALGWRALALSHGLRSCWSSPILSRDKEALGALAFYQRETGSPTAFQRDLIHQLTRIASIAVERARAEGALKRSQTFLAEAQRLSLTGSYSWRLGTNEFTWSEQAHRIFGFEPGVRVTRELIRSRVHPEDLQQTIETMERAHRDGTDIEYEHRLLMPDGTVKYLHMLAHGNRDEDGQLEYIGAVRDITQSRLTEEALGKVRSELAHVSRVTSLGALTASIAHEVNQPLTGVITNASTCLRMLATDPPSIEGARETVRRIIRDGHRAADVITHLRALFKKSGPTAEWVDLNEATREVIALSLSELHRSRVIPRPELAEDLPNITGDRVQLQQVILNLLLNALEAMSGVTDRPRRLVIRTARDEDDCVRLTVQDAGIGIDPQNAGRLFEAFYTTKSEGMGIGLSVSRSIIESHQGRLWAAGNDDGPGASFSFSIPTRPVNVASFQQ